MFFHVRMGGVCGGMPLIIEAPMMRANPCARVYHHNKKCTISCGPSPSVGHFLRGRSLKGRCNIRVYVPVCVPVCVPPLLP